VWCDGGAVSWMLRFLCALLFPLHFISIPHCHHSEIATISDIHKENMVLIYGLDSCLSLLIFFRRDHRVEQLFGYSRSEGCVMFTVYHGGRLLVNLC
jgi:hypothetical protein